MEYNNCYTVNGKEFELQHHGVKGMKWGVRRYQNKDGTRTAAGKKRYRDMSDEEKSARNKKVAKRVAAAMVMTAGVAVAVAAYRKNPDAAKAILSKVGNSTVTAAKKAGSKTYKAGKQYVKDACNGFKEGVAEGFKQAPKKAGQAIVTGVTMMAAKRMLDSVVGKEEAARIFQANNNKKIGSFWKVSQEDRNDDD